MFAKSAIEPWTGRSAVECSESAPSPPGKIGSMPSLPFCRSDRLDNITKYSPAWRNWQTRWTQNPVAARPCGFEPLRRHTLENRISRGKKRMRAAVYLAFYTCMAKGPPECSLVNGSPGKLGEGEPRE